MSAIEPIHHSRKRQLDDGFVRTPRNMSVFAFPSHQARDSMTRIAIDIFTDATNAGVPFQEALVAVYLSGMENGISALRGIKDEEIA